MAWGRSRGLSKLWSKILWHGEGVEGCVSSGQRYYGMGKESRAVLALVKDTMAWGRSRGLSKLWSKILWHGEGSRGLSKLWSKILWHGEGVEGCLSSGQRYYGMGKESRAVLALVKDTMAWGRSRGLC